MVAPIPRSESLHNGGDFVLLCNARIFCDLVLYFLFSVQYSDIFCKQHEINIADIAALNILDFILREAV